MKLNQIKFAALLLGLSLVAATAQTNTLQLPPIASGPFKADWNSLTNYQTPEWFRDAKFGIWAHWGPQCQPEHGDWYARSMYQQGSGDYKSHIVEYGHPSTNGFKDVIHEWKAANFNPDQLLKFYKDNGAKIFMALANHHDNFDLFNSKYQSWNSVARGPQKDLIGGWAAAARKNGLRFSVSVHCSRAWSWYEVAQGADTNGPLAGVPYDGKLTKADGKGLWWDGLDPQELYAQNHAPGAKLEWSWDPAKGSSTPNSAYMEKFFKRTQQLWDDYHPDQIYFDDSVLPFHGVSDEIGLNLAAHFYNTRLDKDGRTEAVMNNKMLNPMQREAMVYDIERGKADGILPQPWQTDTCIGSWHYDANIFKYHYYKDAASVVRMLADIVSKNGNLMLSVPLQRDGQPDADEIKIVSEIGAWLKINGEGIFGSRPNSKYRAGKTGLAGGPFQEKKVVWQSSDYRFTRKDNAVFAYLMRPGGAEKAVIYSLGRLTEKEIKSVEVSSRPTEFEQKDGALLVRLPAGLDEGMPACIKAMIQDKQDFS